MTQDEKMNQLPLSVDNTARVEEQLAIILKSSHFSSAKKMRQFLSFVVGKTLKGEGDKVKQYTIAVDGLDYSDDFDADTNPAIRIMAGRVRERLDKYYNEEGINDSLIIHIEKGQYTPWFEEKTQE